MLDASAIQKAATNYHKARETATEELAFALARAVCAAMYEPPGETQRYYRLAEKFADALKDAGY